MKKIIMTAAVLACAASVVQAQVSSANIVGYSKNFSSGLVLQSAQFDVGVGNDITEVIGDQLPLGSKIYKYNPVGGYVGNISEYGTVFLGGTAWDTPLTLNPGDSYWVEVPSAATNIISGEVPMAAVVTNNIVPGLQLMSYPYPVEVGIDALELTPTVGDKIYKYDPSTGYVGNISEYASVFLGGTAWDTPLVFGVGEGFWYESVAGGMVQWVVTRPF